VRVHGRGDLAVDAIRWCHAESRRASVPPRLRAYVLRLRASVPPRLRLRHRPCRLQRRRQLCRRAADAERRRTAGGGADVWRRESVDWRCRVR